MTAERSAREKFVEAIRHFFTDEDVDKCCIDRARQAIEAFADAECDSRHRCPGTDDYAAAHDICRAALIKEIFGE